MVSALLLLTVPLLSSANDRWSKTLVSPEAGILWKKSGKIISKKRTDIVFTRWPLIEKKRQVSSSEKIRSRATGVVADERIDPTSLIWSSSLAARLRVDVNVEWLADVVQSWGQLIKLWRCIHLHKAKESLLEQALRISHGYARWFW